MTELQVQEIIDILNIQVDLLQNVHDIAWSMATIYFPLVIIALLFWWLAKQFFR